MSWEYKEGCRVSFKLTTEQIEKYDMGTTRWDGTLTNIDFEKGCAVISATASLGRNRLEVFIAIVALKEFTEWNDQYYSMKGELGGQIAEFLARQQEESDPAVESEPIQELKAESDMDIELGSESEKENESSDRNILGESRQSTAVRPMEVSSGILPNAFLSDAKGLKNDDASAGAAAVVQPRIDQAEIVVGQDVDRNESGDLQIMDMSALDPDDPEASDPTDTPEPEKPESGAEEEGNPGSSPVRQAPMAPAENASDPAVESQEEANVPGEQAEPTDEDSDSDCINRAEAEKQKARKERKRQEDEKKKEIAREKRKELRARRESQMRRDEERKAARKQLLDMSIPENSQGVRRSRRQHIPTQSGHILYDLKVKYDADGNYIGSEKVKKTHLTYDLCYELFGKGGIPTKEQAKSVGIRFYKKTFAHVKMTELYSDEGEEEEEDQEEDQEGQEADGGNENEENEGSEESEGNTLEEENFEYWFQEWRPSESEFDSTDPNDGSSDDENSTGNESREKTRADTLWSEAVTDDSQSEAEETVERRGKTSKRKKEATKQTRADTLSSEAVTDDSQSEAEETVERRGKTSKRKKEATKQDADTLWDEVESNLDKKKKGRKKKAEESQSTEESQSDVERPTERKKRGRPPKTTNQDSGSKEKRRDKRKRPDQRKETIEKQMHKSKMKEKERAAKEKEREAKEKEREAKEKERAAKGKERASKAKEKSRKKEEEKAEEERRKRRQREEEAKKRKKESAEKKRRREEDEDSADSEIEFDWEQKKRSPNKRPDRRRSSSPPGPGPGHSPPGPSGIQQRDLTSTPISTRNQQRRSITEQLSQSLRRSSVGNSRERRIKVLNEQLRKMGQYTAVEVEEEVGGDNIYITDDSNEDGWMACLVCMTHGNERSDMLGEISTNLYLKVILGTVSLTVDHSSPVELQTGNSVEIPPNTDWWMVATQVVGAVVRLTFNYGDVPDDSRMD